MALTDVAIRALKPADKVQKISDGEGLQLWVMPVGSRLWRYAYRYSGEQKTLALGAYPEITLAEARKKRDEARALLVSGVDPGQQRKLEKITKAISDAATFDAVAEEYLAKKMREGMAASTVIRHDHASSTVSRIIGSPLANAVKTSSSGTSLDRRISSIRTTSAVTRSPRSKSRATGLLASLGMNPSFSPSRWTATASAS